MTGLVGWWPLNEDSGNTAYDLSGNGNHGTLNGGVTQGVAGKGGLTSFSFDGNDDYISTDMTSLPESFSLSLWVKVDSEADDATHFLSVFNSTSQDVSIRWQKVSDEWSFAVDRGKNLKSDAGALDEWHHLVFVADASSGQQIWEDGSLVASTSTSWTGNHEPGGNVQIGRKAGYSDDWMHGNVCNVHLFDRALTPEEIQELYEWRSGDYAKPLNDSNSSSAVSRWAFDGDATDSWGENDGTVSGAASVSGVRGQAYDFNDGEDEIVVPNNSELHGEGTGDFSVSTWVSPHSISDNQSNDRNIITIKRRAGTDPRKGWVLSFPSQSEIAFLIEDSNNNLSYPTYDNGSKLDLDSWYHMVGVRSQDQASVFVNGIKKASSSASSIGDISNSEELYIGQTNDTDSNYPGALNGSVDDLRIYSKALSPSEVFELYRWGTRGRDMRKLTVNSR